MKLASFEYCDDEKYTYIDFSNRNLHHSFRTEGYAMNEFDPDEMFEICAASPAFLHLAGKFFVTNGTANICRYTQYLQPNGRWGHVPFYFANLQAAEDTLWVIAGDLAEFREKDDNVLHPSAFVEGTAP